MFSSSLILFMISMESLAKLSLGKILAAAWVFFTSVYFLISVSAPYILAKTETALINNAVNTQLNTVFKQGQDNGQTVGFQAAISQLGQALTTQLKWGCKDAVPVTISSGTTIGILSTNCLQQGSAQVPDSAKK